MDDTKRVLVICKDFKSVKHWLHTILDIYMDIEMVTSWNSKKNKIHMFGNYTWYFKEQKDIPKEVKYYKTMTDEELEKELREKKLYGDSVQSDSNS